MSAEYALGYGRPPFLATGRMVVRRAFESYKIGDEIPPCTWQPRTVAMLWDQGWIDTLPAAPKSDKIEQRRK